ncbi:spore coat protein [Tepidibacillus marianensis]|uniref:spore coat protein n=1 Tax=Tepidibacillus marianensis TaxID=3131995 RepID=UPI0030D3CAF9
MNLTQKEQYLLEDQKSHEEMCIKKYTNYIQQAQDPELKQMFQTHAQHEKQHLNSINQILSGTVPSVSQGQQGGQSQQGMQAQHQNQQNQKTNQATMQAGNQQTGMINQSDADLCQDVLAAEKYVSGTYDTAIFEFRDTNIRQVLNHIQKEEQQHGENIFNYMQRKGMYNPQ